MEEQLFGLTPAEWWAWCYLILLAARQGSCAIKFPRPGDDPQAEATFTRKHLKRLLKSLKGHRLITLLEFPRSKNKQIEVLLAASKIGDMGVPNNKIGDLQVLNNNGLGTSSSPIKALGTNKTPINVDILNTLPEDGPLQAKLKTSLKAFLSLKASDLRIAIACLTDGQSYRLRLSLVPLCNLEPQGRGYSERLKLFVVLRFLQESGIQRPQHWMNRVASQEHAQETKKEAICLSSRIKHEAK